MEQETAVEWLLKQINKQSYSLGDINIAINVPKDIIEQAKQMEKEQIFNAFGVGCQVESTRLIGYHGMAEQYYNEKYKK